MWRQTENKHTCECSGEKAGPGDRKQAVWEGLTGKVTFEQRPKEEEGGGLQSAGGRAAGQREHPAKTLRQEPLEIRRRPVQLQWSESGKVGRRVRRDSGASQATLRTWAFTREVLSKGGNYLTRSKGCCPENRWLGRGGGWDTSQEAVVIAQAPGERRGRWHQRDNREETSAQTQTEL